MVMDWRTARHLGAGSAESYDGTRREARLPELTGGQLQAFVAVGRSGAPHKQAWRTLEAYRDRDRDRKSTRLNSSHVSRSYAVFCLKKKTGRSSRLYHTGKGLCSR